MEDEESESGEIISGVWVGARSWILELLYVPSLLSLEDTLLLIDTANLYSQ
jgi:hypothetical protein